MEGKIPALPPETFLTPMDKGKRKIIPKKFEGCEYKNIVTKYTSANSRGYKVPDAKTEQYKSSFFVRTVADWNQLPENVVQAKSAAAYTTAVDRVVLETTLQ